MNYREGEKCVRVVFLERANHCCLAEIISFCWFFQIWQIKAMWFLHPMRKATYNVIERYSRWQKAKKARLWDGLVPDFLYQKPVSDASQHLGDCLLVTEINLLGSKQDILLLTAFYKNLGPSSTILGDIKWHRNFAPLPPPDPCQNSKVTCSFEALKAGQNWWRMKKFRHWLNILLFEVHILGSLFQSWPRFRCQFEKKVSGHAFYNLHNISYIQVSSIFEIPKQMYPKFKWWYIKEFMFFMLAIKDMIVELRKFLKVF